MKRIFLAFLLAFAVIFCPAANAATAIRGSKVYSCNRSRVKKVALTFDDSPHPVLTKKITEVLKKYDVRATFFVVGINAVNYPSHLSHIIDAGCEIGNHTYSHKDLSCLSSKDIEREIKKCEDTIEGLTGITPTLFRPPMGACSKNLYEYCLEADYGVILWSIDTLDWANTKPQKIADTVLDNLSDGDIILMHDYVSGSSHTVEALEIIIPEILSRGYEFVTVSELIE